MLCSPGSGRAWCIACVHSHVASVPPVYAPTGCGGPLWLPVCAALHGSGAYSLVALRSSPAGFRPLVPRGRRRTARTRVPLGQAQGQGSRDAPRRNGRPQGKLLRRPGRGSARMGLLTRPGPCPRLPGSSVRSGLQPHCGRPAVVSAQQVTPPEPVHPGFGRCRRISGLEPTARPYLDAWNACARCLPALLARPTTLGATKGPGVC